MIVVCGSGHDISPDALRERIFSAGYPCTTASVKEIWDLQPVKLIVCDYEAFNELRHGPYDHIFAVVIGNGFVNSALNAQRVRDEEEALEAVKAFFLRTMKIGASNEFPFGILTTDSVFFSFQHFELFGNIIQPKTSEYMIFKYLYAFSEQKQYFPSEKIRRFCYARALQSEENTDGNIAVHISSLNRTIRKVYGKQLIRSVRYKGYYLDRSRL